MKFLSFNLKSNKMHTLQDIAQKIGTMSVKLAGASGSAEETSATLAIQAETLERISAHITDIAGQSRRTIEKSDASKDVARRAVSSSRESAETLTKILSKANSLAADVLEMGTRLTSVQEKLSLVQKISLEIDAIAQRASLLSLNAAVEAARAGESGQGFRVVASEFKSLSEYTATSTIQITNSLEDLTHEIANLVATATASVVVANELETDAQGIDEHIQNVPKILATVVQNQNEISSDTADISQSVDHINSQVSSLSTGVTLSVGKIKEVADSLDELRSISENLTGQTPKLEVKTADTVYIENVKKIAGQISAVFEAGIKRGLMNADALFDKDYVEIYGTNPVQYETAYLSFLDRMLPPIQEAALKLSDRVVFCAAVDVNGYLPTHNNKFSKPQRPEDPEWNTANSRNRRIFNDRVGLAAGQNTNDFLLQAYRRDMGNGTFALMKDVSAPIFVNGRHWGGVRLAYSV